MSPRELADNALAASELKEFGYCEQTCPPCKGSGVVRKTSTIHEIEITNDEHCSYCGGTGRYFYYRDRT